MSYRSYLSRQDLYSHGLRKAWEDDRWELEAALWEIDQLERQTEYEYQRPPPGYSWTSGRSPAWGPPCIRSNARYYDVQTTRSNSDLYSVSEPRMTSLSSQSYSSFDGYQKGYGHRTYPSSGYPSQSSTVSQDDQPSHYTLPFRTPISTYQDFRDYMSIPHSSNHQYYDFSPSMTYSRTSYRPSYHSQHSAQRISTPDQLQMITWSSDQDGCPSPDTVHLRHTSATPVPPDMISPHWSMIATEGTTRSESPPVTSSGGMYAPHEIYGSSDEDEDEEYISDSVASDDTEYYDYFSESEQESESDI